MAITRNQKGQFVNGNNPGIVHRFVKGSTPWNKGKNGYMGANETSFKKGSIPPQQQPLGHISRLLNKGIVEYAINIDWRGNRKPHNSYKWYLWELENQEDRPKNMVLYIKNGDFDDLRTENFELITRAELLARNRGRSV